MHLETSCPLPCRNARNTGENFSARTPIVAAKVSDWYVWKRTDTRRPRGQSARVSAYGFKGNNLDMPTSGWVRGFAGLARANAFGIDNSFTLADFMPSPRHPTTPGFSNGSKNQAN